MDKKNLFVYQLNYLGHLILCTKIDQTIVCKGVALKTLSAVTYTDLITDGKHS